MQAPRIAFLRRSVPILGEKGTAAVEFGLCLPFLMLLVVGATDFGRALYTHHILVKSVRDSVRYLSRVANPSSTASQTTATNLAFRGSISATAPLLIPHSTANNYAITFGITNTTNRTAFYSSPEIITGTLTYRFTSPLMRAFGFNGAFTMTLGHIERYIGS